MFKNFLALLLFAALASAPLTGVAREGTPQATVGAVQGQVTDAAGAVIAGAVVTLVNSITSYKVTTKTDDAGNFKFLYVPFNSYKVSVGAPEFQPVEQTVDVHSAVPTQLTMQLTPKGLSEQVNVSAGESTALIEADRTAADTDLNTTDLMKGLGAAPSRGLQKMVESAPGVVSDDGGRIHVRGSESNVQTVINGVPVMDNMSAIFSTSIDP